ncbi:kinase-like domain-containing protein [Flagelloscypha sp. PMI_526]|nr:kinase-like domain-containing protein [Flagelloscypha sp. PMI_526]
MNAFQAFLYEAVLWYQLRHRNILPFLGVSYDAFPNRICFVLPFKENGDIMSFIRRDSPPLIVRTEWLYHIAKGVEYIHGMEICHGDIKGVNILVDDDGMPLITDFGNASMVTSRSETLADDIASSEGFISSLRWSAPEFFLSTSYAIVHASLTTDIYALVSTMLEILTGRPPWVEELTDSHVLLRASVGGRPKRPNTMAVPDGHWSLIERGWAQEPHDRATIGELVHELENLTTVVRRDAGEGKLLSSLEVLMYLSTFY